MSSNDIALDFGHILLVVLSIPFLIAVLLLIQTLRPRHARQLSHPWRWLRYCRRHRVGSNALGRSVWIKSSTINKASGCTIAANVDILIENKTISSGNKNYVKNGQT